MAPLTPEDDDVIVRSRFTLPRIAPAIRFHANSDPALKAVVERTDRVVIILENILRKFRSYDTTLVAGVPSGNVVGQLTVVISGLNALTLRVADLEAAVLAIEEVLDDLEERVAALEEGGGGGGANLCDIVWTEDLDMVLSEDLCVVIHEAV
jgi:hypothetical protein